MRFFFITFYYLRIEIINTINVAKAIIKDNASYTLMLITSLPRGKPNTSNYLIDYSLAADTKVANDGKKRRLSEANLPRRHRQPQ